MTEKTKKIIIPYKPEKLWKDVIHPNLESHRFSVVVAHRRFGKTVGTVNHLIKMAIKNKRISPQYAYIAPYRTQAKMIAWRYIKYYTNVIPGIKINESELYIEFPSKHKGAAGARIYVVGADNPDVLRGTYWDGAVIDEYAQIKDELWNEVIRPAIADRKGWVVFIGTPKGQNQFYEIYQRAMREKDWYVCMYRADESGLFDIGGRYGPDELDSMKNDMTESAVRQELYCDFTASATNILITIDLATKASKRVYSDREVAGAAKILGVDVARFGNDSSAITRRQGLCIFKAQKYQGLDNMALAERVIYEINTWQPDAVFIDAGRGEGVIDRCRQLGYSVTEVNFGGKALKANRYANKRTEMWDEMRKCLEAGGAIPDDPDLKTELVAPEYSFDSAGRMQLESKDKIKERIGKSPDEADSIALTFAVPVIPLGQTRGRMSKCNSDYDPYAD